MSALNFLISIACLASVVVAFSLFAIVNRLDQIIGILTQRRSYIERDDGVTPPAIKHIDVVGAQTPTRR